MSQPDYSGTAVIVFHDAGFGEGMWRASCPVDCGWHGNDHIKREDAMTASVLDAKGHRCLRAPAAVAEVRPSLRATEAPKDPGGTGPGPTPPGA